MDSTVVFSGTGVVTASGMGLDANMEAMMRGESFMRPSRRWDSAGCNTDFYGEVPLTNEELRATISAPLRSERFLPLERGELLFLNAMQEALQNAHLDLRDVDRSRVALLAGTSLSGFTNLEMSWREHLTNGTPPDLASLLVYPLNVMLDRAALEFELSGPRYLFSTACSASLHPVIWGSQLLDRDEADIVILGGTDPLSLISMVGFSCLRSVAKRSSTPFSLGDPGVSIGEGAGAVVMERMSSFRRRSSREVRSYLAGASGNSDAYHPTASDPMGTSIRRCIEESLKHLDAAEDASSILVTHGTGTLHNDKVESRAIQQVGSLKGRLKVTSIKSMIGHTLGASGCVELALLIKSMDSDVALPTANFSEPRPGCDLDVVRNQGIAYQADIGVKSAFAFGGNNVVVSMTRTAERNGRKPVEYDEDPIVITGIGMMSAFGELGDAELLTRIANGESAIRSIEAVRAFSKTNVSRRAAVLGEADLSALCETHRIKDHRKMDKITRIATIASQKCLKSSGMAVKQGNAYDIGLISGTSTGHLDSVASFYTDFTLKGPAYADAGLFPNTVVNAHAGYITIQLRIKGYTTVVTQGNLSGMVALDLACRSLRSGMCKMMLAGATSEYSSLHHRALLETGLANDEFHPYSGASKGNCLGEGSVFLALERRSDALARGARILGTLADVRLAFSPAIPSTFRFRSNPLERLLGAPRKDGRPSSILGDGNGHVPAFQLETAALSAMGGETPLRSFSPQFGYVTGVNPLNNIAIACLLRQQAESGADASDPEARIAIARLAEEIGDAPTVTCLSEGGGAGVASLRF